MSYATVLEIKSMFRDFADNTQAAVDDTEIQLFLDNNSAIIDSKIGTLYVLPISGTESLKILKQLQMYGVACIIDDILNDYSEADKKPMWCKKFKMMLDQLVPPINPKTCKQCDPIMMLPDSEFTGTKSSKGRRMSLQSTAIPTFEKGVDKW